MKVPKETVELFASFLSGGIDIPTFERRVADRLFVLRQTPQVTEEKGLLAAIQLRLHRIGEGGNEIEVYMAAQSAMDTVAPQKVTARTDVDNAQPRSSCPPIYQPSIGKLEVEVQAGTSSILVPV